MHSYDTKPHEVLPMNNDFFDQFFVFFICSRNLHHIININEDLWCSSDFLNSRSFCFFPQCVWYDKPDMET